MTAPLPGAGLAELRAALASGATTPRELVENAYEGLEALEAAVISFVPRHEAIARAEATAPDGRLAGIPFVVKDNIDVAGVPTTAGCPAFAYLPERPAEVVRRLEAAGAIAVAKTNLDQFATGLVGTRSPYGTPRNVFDAARVPGGSSSGSAVAVAAGAVPFSLGTDTAGSGRVPAAANGIVGAKPTRGWLSTTGVVPAVRSLDCVSVFARSVDDARAVLEVAGGFDPHDPFSRRPAWRPRPAPADVRVGAADGVVLDGVDVAETVDLEPFLEAGRLLYEGPWVAERVAAFGRFVAGHPDDIDPTVRRIVDGARRWSAADFAEGQYRLAESRRKTEPIWRDIDALVTPTVTFLPLLAEVAADPIGVNTALGRYTTFANLLDLCAVAVPTGVVDGLPVGVTVLAPAWGDAVAAAVAEEIVRGAASVAGVELAVVGAHLRGQPLHEELVRVGAVFVEQTRTAPEYRLYALANTAPPKPGLVRAAGGAAIEVEVYRLTYEAFGRFVAAVPAPLCIGTVQLARGPVAGFLCEPSALDGATEITSFGGWRAYRAAR
ncbi:MAG: allophanate hydrolase [Acidimicrobiales bacterium]